jgi:hypothetical protein
VNTFDAIQEELRFARRKFPSNKRLVNALTEEFLEFIKALDDYDHGKCSLQEVFHEGVQTAAMVIRTLEEGDPQYQYEFSDRLPSSLKGRGDAE